VLMMMGDPMIFRCFETSAMFLRLGLVADPLLDFAEWRANRDEMRDDVAAGSRWKGLMGSRRRQRLSVAVPWIGRCCQPWVSNRWNRKMNAFFGIER
jgi:hypothetical protein